MVKNEVMRSSHDQGRAEDKVMQNTLYGPKDKAQKDVMLTIVNINQLYLYKIIIHKISLNEIHVPKEHYLRLNRIQKVTFLTEHQEWCP